MRYNHESLKFKYPSSIAYSIATTDLTKKAQTASNDYIDGKPMKKLDQVKSLRHFAHDSEDRKASQRSNMLEDDSLDTLELYDLK